MGILSKFAVVLALSFSSLAFGSVDYGPPSVDRGILDQAMARAQAENKSIILEVSAAWCGPCNQFAYDMDTHPDNFKKLADSGYILVKMESEKVVQGSQLMLTDYLPYFIEFFPSVYFYSPASGWKFLGSVTSFQELTDTLAAVANADKPMTPAELKTYIETIGATPNGDLSAGAGGIKYFASLYNMAETYSYAEAKEILSILRTEDTAFPALQIKDTADDVESIFIMSYLANGQVSSAQLAIDFPTVAASLTDVSRTDFSNALFGTRVAFTFRTQGLAAASQQCDAIYQGVRAGYVPGTMADADFQKKLEAFDFSAKVFCADVELRANGASPALIQKVATFDKSRISNWHLIAGVGDLAGAAAIYHKQFQNYADSYNRTLATWNAQLATATTQTLIDQLNQSIKLMTFKLQHHTTVDAEAEAAIMSGQPLQALEIEN